jgi:GntR family transcriptional regulator
VSVRRDSPLPLYYQIREILREEITSKHLPLGTPFPTETELMQRFDVSRTTVRKAMDDLVLQGLVRRVQGQGTFIRARNEEREFAALCSLADMAPRSRPLTWEVIRAEHVEATPRVAEGLNIALGDPVTYIERLGFAEDIPQELGESWLPRDLGQRVVEGDLTLHLLVDLLEERCGVHLGDADCTIEAYEADGRLPQLLQVREGAALLVMERTDYAVDQRPVLYHRWYCRGDRLVFSVQLKKRDELAHTITHEPSERDV